MHRIHLRAGSFSRVIVFITLYWGIAGKHLEAQTPDPTDWYGNRVGYYRDSNDDADYFHDESAYDPNEYDDFYYDPDYSPGYDTSFFPRDYSVLGRDYSAYGVEFGPTRFGGGDRPSDPRTGSESPSLFGSTYGFDNSSHPGSGTGNDHFTDDWYDDNSDFANWY